VRRCFIGSIGFYLLALASLFASRRVLEHLEIRRRPLWPPAEST
jgi:hypothetical protein